MSKQSSFEIDVRVYIEDTDAGGIVYHANYLKYLERARTEFVRGKGFELQKSFETGVSYVVHSMALRYHQPARLDDVLRVSVELDKVAKTYFSFKQNIFAVDGELKLSADVKVACVSLPELKPSRLPAGLKQQLENLE